jgi:integrase
VLADAGSIPAVSTKSQQTSGLTRLAELETKKPFGFGHKSGHNQAAFFMIGNYLLRTSSGQYRFRIRVPTCLVSSLGKHEIRESLGTDSARAARLLALHRAAEYKFTFEIMMKKIKTASRSRQKESEDFGVGLITFFDSQNRPVTIDYAGDVEQELRAAKELMPPSSHLPATKSTGSTLCLSEALTQYLDEVASKGIAERSIADYKAMIQDFILLHGDTALRAVTRDSVVKTYSRFKKLPPNRNKKPEFRDLTIDEILSQPKKQLVSASTCRKFISRISQFFNWCVTWEFLERNPAAGLMEKRGSESTERLPYEDDDLALIFGSIEYQQDSFKHPYQFWIPLIALFTGARLNEICQLRAQDVRQVDGILCFDITPNAGKLKTEASERLVPVHSSLRALGIEAFSKRQLVLGQPRLFPELPLGREGPGQVASKWYKRYRDRCGVADSKKPFHSFRHTVWTRLSRQGCPDYEIDDLIGHESTTIGSKRYRSRLLPEHLAQTVEKLHFDVEEISALIKHQ